MSDQFHTLFSWGLLAQDNDRSRLAPAAIVTVVPLAVTDQGQSFGEQMAKQEVTALATRN